MRSGSRAAIGHHMHAPSGHHLRAASGDHVASLGPCWVHVGTILGPCWRRLGVILGPSWAHAGSSWDHFGVTWGHFWAIRCLCGASFKPRGARAGGPHLSPPNFGPKVFPGRPFWTPKMGPKSAPDGVMHLLCALLLSSLFRGRVQDASKRLPRGPREPPKGPRDPQGGPRDPP